MTPDEFRKPYPELRQRLLAAGIIGLDHLAADPPLCEALKKIQTIHEVIDLLRARDHTIAWSHEFKQAFDLVPEDQERLIDLFYRAMRECMDRRGRLRVVTLAAGTLTYVWDGFEGHPEIRGFSATLEASLNDLPPQMVLMAEPLSYIATLHGQHGAFTRNVERMITDPAWRRADFKERLRYCAGVAGRPTPNALARRVAIGRNIAQHLQTRRHLSEILCHDIGRVIEVYPDLARYRRHRQLAEFIREGILTRLANAGITASLRSRAADLITAPAIS